MINLQVSDDELRDLRALLREEVNETRDELRRTEAPAYHEGVKSRLERLEGLLRRTEALTPSVG